MRQIVLNIHLATMSAFGNGIKIKPIQSSGNAWTSYTEPLSQSCAAIAKHLALAEMIAACTKGSAGYQAKPF